MDFDFDLYVKAEEEMKNATNNTGGVLSSIARVVSLEKPKTVDVSGVISVLSQFSSSISSDMTSFSTMFGGWKEAILSFYQQQGSFQQQYEDLMLQIQQDNVSQFLWDRINIPFVHGAIDNKIEGIEGKKQELVQQAKELEKILKWANIETPNIPGYLARTGATVAKFGVSVLEGLTKLAESIVDFGAILATASFVPLTSIVDGANWVSSKIFGTNYDSVTKAMWKNTKAFTSTDYTTGLYDKFYKDTKIGQTIDKYSFYSDTMRSVGVGVGYIGGIIGLSVLTCGAAGLTAATPVLSATSVSAAAGATSSLTIGSLAFTSGASAAAAATAATVAGTGSMVLTTQGVVAGALAAMAGIGKNTSAAWADGASTGEGLAYGTVAGMYEGFQMAGGMAVNSLNLAKGATLLTQQIRNTATHVALDTVDGASSGFIDPLFKSIYTPNEKNMEQIMSYVNYDKDGNQISNKTWNDLTSGEKYDALFKSNGGWNTVGSGAVSAAIVSGVSEVKDIKGAIKGMSIAAATPALPEASIPRLKAGSDESVVGDIDDAGNFTIKDGFYKADGVTPAVEPKTLYATDMPKKQPIINAKFESSEPRKSIFENISDRIKSAREPKVEVVTEVPEKAKLVGASDPAEPSKVIYADAGKGTEATTHDSSTIYVNKDGAVVEPETVVKTTDTIRSKDIVEDAKYEAVEPKKNTASEAYENARTTAAEKAATRATAAAEKATKAADKVKATFATIDNGIEKAKAQKTIIEAKLAEYSPEAKMINNDTDPVIYARSVEDAAKKSPIGALYENIKNSAIKNSEAKVVEAAVPKKTIFDVIDNTKKKVEESPVLSKLFGKTDNVTAGSKAVSGSTTKPIDIKPNTIGADGTIYAGAATAASMGPLVSKIDVPEVKPTDIISDTTSGILKTSTDLNAEPNILKSSMGSVSKPEVEVSHGLFGESPVDGYNKVIIDGKEITIPKNVIEYTGKADIEALLKGKLSQKAAYEVLKKLDGNYSRYSEGLLGEEIKPELSASRKTIIKDLVEAGDYEKANKLLLESLKDSETSNPKLRSLFGSISEPNKIKPTMDEVSKKTDTATVVGKESVSSSEVVKPEVKSKNLKSTMGVTSKNASDGSELFERKTDFDGTSGRKSSIGDETEKSYSTPVNREQVNLQNPINANTNLEDSMFINSVGEFRATNLSDKVLNFTIEEFKKSVKMDFRKMDVIDNSYNMAKIGDSNIFIIDDYLRSIEDGSASGVLSKSFMNTYGKFNDSEIKLIREAAQKYNSGEISSYDQFYESLPSNLASKAKAILDDGNVIGTDVLYYNPKNTFYKPSPGAGNRAYLNPTTPEVHLETIKRYIDKCHDEGVWASSKINGGGGRGSDRLVIYFDENYKKQLKILNDITNDIKSRNPNAYGVPPSSLMISDNEAYSFGSNMGSLEAGMAHTTPNDYSAKIYGQAYSIELLSQDPNVREYVVRDLAKQKLYTTGGTALELNEKDINNIISDLINNKYEVRIKGAFFKVGVTPQKIQFVPIQSSISEGIREGKINPINIDLDAYRKRIIETHSMYQFGDDLHKINPGIDKHLYEDMHNSIGLDTLESKKVSVSSDSEVVDPSKLRQSVNEADQRPKFREARLAEPRVNVEGKTNVGEVTEERSSGKLLTKSGRLKSTMGGVAKEIDTSTAIKNIEIDPTMKAIYDKIIPSSYRLGDKSAMPQSFMDDVSRDIKSGALLKATDGGIKPIQLDNNLTFKGSIEEGTESYTYKIVMGDEEYEISKLHVDLIGKEKIEAMLKGELSPRETYDVLRKVDSKYRESVTETGSTYNVNLEDLASKNKKLAAADYAYEGNYDLANKSLLESMQETKKYRLEIENAAKNYEARIENVIKSVGLNDSSKSLSGEQLESSISILNETGLDVNPKGFFTRDLDMAIREKIGVSNIKTFDDLGRAIETIDGLKVKAMAQIEELKDSFLNIKTSKDFSKQYLEYLSVGERSIFDFSGGRGKDFNAFYDGLLKKLEEAKNLDSRGVLDTNSISSKLKSLEEQLKIANEEYKIKMQEKANYGSERSNGGLHLDEKGIIDYVKSKSAIESKINDIANEFNSINRKIDKVLEDSINTRIEAIGYSDDIIARIKSEVINGGDVSLIERDISTAFDNYKKHIVFDSINKDVMLATEAPHKIGEINTKINATESGSQLSGNSKSEIERAKLGNNADGAVESTNPKIISGLTKKQNAIVNAINQTLATEPIANIRYRNTSTLSSSILENVDDLSRVRIKIDGAYRSLDGKYKARYLDDSEFDARITYTGHELIPIIKRLEGLESMIDKSLPIEARARQIYEVLATELKPGFDDSDIPNGVRPSEIDKAVRGLRGITANNGRGREGLVCAGYAVTYKELCDRCGVPCEYVAGAAISINKGKRGLHAWNVVVTEKGEIPVDVTWKSTMNEVYFGKSDKFADSHVANPGETYSNYAPINSGDAVIFDISKTVSKLDSIYGTGQGILLLAKVSDTFNYSCIPIEGGVRMSLMKTMTPDDIGNYLREKVYEGLSRLTSAKLDIIVSEMDNKYGLGSGMEGLSKYCKTWNSESITNTNGARELLKNVRDYEIEAYLSMKQDGGKK